MKAARLRLLDRVPAHHRTAAQVVSSMRKTRFQTVCCCALVQGSAMDLTLRGSVDGACECACRATAWRRPAQARTETSAAIGGA